MKEIIYFILYGKYYVKLLFEIFINTYRFFVIFYKYINIIYNKFNNFYFIYIYVLII